MKDFKVYLV
jgi:hypothetical protein